MIDACGITTFWCPPLHHQPATTTASTFSEEGYSDERRRRYARGIIKQIPEDFVVVEIDPAGQLTTASPYIFPKPSRSDPIPGDSDTASATVEADAAPVDHLAEAQRSLELQLPEIIDEFGSCDAMAQKALTLSWFDLCDMVHYMRQVDRSKANGSGPVARQSNEATAKGGESLAAEVAMENLARPWWAVQFPMGCYESKQARRLIHFAVRRLLPHLTIRADSATITDRSAAGMTSSPPSASNGADGSASLSIAVDLPHLFWVAVLGEAAARHVIQWMLLHQASQEAHHLDIEERRLLNALPNSFEPPPAGSSQSCRTSFDRLETLYSHRHDISQTMGPSNRADDAESSITMKDMRRFLHETLRRHAPYIRCLVNDGDILLRLHQGPGTSTAATRKRHRSDSAAEAACGSAGQLSTATACNVGPQLFLHFVVRKRNLETMEMRQLLSEYLHVKVGAVCVAGMKDKKGITVQRCSAPATAVPHLQCNTVVRWPTDPKGSFAEVLHCAPEPFASPVNIGELSGNYFELRVRQLQWGDGGRVLSHRHRGEQVDLCGSALDGGEGEERGSRWEENGEGRSTAAMQRFITDRFDECTKRGFINYFGQQRFCETISDVADHTGVHLFAGRWVEAVRSLYRGCPEVYDAFPLRMEARFVPGNSRDAQTMTHALRMTYRMFYSERPLTSRDVKEGSPLWTAVCQKAISEGTPYLLRSLWIHAAQSVFFNIAASAVVEGYHWQQRSAQLSNSASGAPPPPSALQCLPYLSDKLLAISRLPLGGYSVTAKQLTALEGGDDGSSDAAVWAAWSAAAVAHAMKVLQWPQAETLTQRKVVGVPVPGTWRQVIVLPLEASISFITASPATMESGGTPTTTTTTTTATDALLSFRLPSSSYATVFLREVLGCDDWW